MRCYIASHSTQETDNVETIAYHNKEMSARHLTATAAILLLAGCVDPPTSVVLQVHAASNLPAVDSLRLTLFDEQGIVVNAKRLPEPGPNGAMALKLPDSVVLYPDRDSGVLRIQVAGLAGSMGVGEGTTKVTVVPKSQVWASVTIYPGRQPDGDGDGVPDVIDNCPDTPNPDQRPCVGDARPDGPKDGGVDGDFMPLTDQLSPDQDCDKDDDGYRSAACGGTDCDDSSDKANPGATEGPPGGATCSDGLDNDCDGHKDLDDSDCVACTSAAECDDKLSCTADSCTGGVCKHTATNEGLPCTENKCVNSPKCTAGKCDGAAKTCPPSSNPCKAAACNPATGCYIKNLPNGTTCSDGDPCTTKEKCTSGNCVDPTQTPTCYISGTCHADGYKPDSCRSCDVSSSETAWTIASNSCYISGTCRASSYNLSACRECIPSKSQTSWSIVSGTCYINGTCYQSGDAGTGCLVCTPGTSATSWIAKPDCGIVLVALNSGYTGNLGGLTGANSKCQTQATAAGLTGTYKALLSTATQSAKGVVLSTSATQPVYNSKGQQLYSSWNAMFSPSKWTSGRDIYSFAGKEVDENTGASPEWDDADAWHGSTATGRHHGQRVGGGGGPEHLPHHHRDP